MAASFSCERRHLAETTPNLQPADAKYGTYYTTASRLDLDDEESPALVLLWTQQNNRWQIVAWATEVP
jgi:hypothetical protein